VVSESWPQCTGEAFLRWLRLFSRMATGGMIQAHEGENGKEKYVTDAHKNLFVYGWGYCDTTSRIAEAAWIRYKNDPSAASASASSMRTADFTQCIACGSMGAGVPSIRSTVTTWLSATHSALRCWIGATSAMMRRFPPTNRTGTGAPLSSSFSDSSGNEPYC
jgi:hypothetical protein